MNPGIAESERIRTILLVEDDESTRSFIQRFLERDGYEVVGVDAAEEGIVEAAETIPDVLIADIHLPGLNGIELASFLLAQDPSLPVILMTGDPDEDLARRALACGPVQYLLKPFEWFEMEAAVGFALRQRQAVEGMAVMNGGGVDAIDEPMAPAESGLGGDMPDPVDGDADDPDLESAGDDEIADGVEPDGPEEGPAEDEIRADLEAEARHPEALLEPQPPIAIEPAADTEPDPFETEAPDEIEPVSDQEAVPFDPEAAEVPDWSEDTPLPAAELSTELISDPGFAEVGSGVELELEPADPDDEASIERVELDPITENEPEPFATLEVGMMRPEGNGGSPASAVEEATSWLSEVDRTSYAGPGHGDRAAGLALALHDAMDEPGPIDPQDLALAARVHEVGRLRLPEGDPIELAMRGAEVLAEAGFPTPVIESVRHMHERWDGTAGPEQLSGPRINMGSQLLAVADALDHYSSAWIRSGIEPGKAADRAMNLVTVQQNQAFSPLVVGAMHQAAAALRDICAQERPPEYTDVSPTPAVAATETVPFALFATE